MAPTLAIYSFGHNLEDIQYPYIESIRSALYFTRHLGVFMGGTVYFAICDCSDKTEDRIRNSFPEEIQDGELKLFYHPWGDSHLTQVEICNYLLDQIGNQEVFAMKLDADEVLHEDSLERFRLDLSRMSTMGNILGRPHYTHMLDPRREFDFIYRSRAVISRTSMGLRFTDNDACAIGGAPEYQTQLEIFHFGKWGPGREREALQKEISFTKLYGKPFGFPDERVTSQADKGYLDYDMVFEHAAQHGEMRSFYGTFPMFAKPWIARMEQREIEFQRELASGTFKKAEVERWWE
jgi:hypothetical protein